MKELLPEIITGVSALLVGVLTTWLMKFNERIKESRAYKMLKQYMEEAEKFEGYSGPEKREYVLSKLIRFYNKIGLKFDEEKITEQINNEVSFTKIVNARDKDKEEVLSGINGIAETSFDVNRTIINS